MLNKSENCDAIPTEAFKTDGSKEAERRNVLIPGSLDFVSRDQTQWRLVDTWFRREKAQFQVNKQIFHLLTENQEWFWEMAGAMLQFKQQVFSIALMWAKRANFD